jgi:hypothetical protein
MRVFLKLTINSWSLLTIENVVHNNFTYVTLILQVKCVRCPSHVSVWYDTSLKAPSVSLVYSVFDTCQCLIQNFMKGLEHSVLDLEHYLGVSDAFSCHQVNSQWMKWMLMFIIIPFIFLLRVNMYICHCHLIKLINTHFLWLVYLF